MLPLGMDFWRYAGSFAKERRPEDGQADSKMVSQTVPKRDCSVDLRNLDFQQAPIVLLDFPTSRTLENKNGRYQGILGQEKYTGNCYALLSCGYVDLACE